MPDDLYAVRATAHRIALLAGPEAAATVIGSYDGWSRLDRDPREIGKLTRAFACALRLDPELQVTTYGPDGDARSDARATALPGGAGLLRQARTYQDPRYSPRARLTDACRALGVPLALLLPQPAPPPAGAVPAPRTAVVVVARPGPAAAADAVLTGQSAWTVPLGPRWSLHFWDGDGTPASPAAAARVLSGRRPAAACWWSADEAGFVVVRGGKPVAGHQWGGRAPVTPESSAAAGRVLAAEFGIPDLAVTLTATLRRRDLAPADALASLFDLLGLPGAGAGRATTASLAAWAATEPTAVHTPRMSGMAAVRRAVRATAPPRTPWRRLIDGGIAVVMGLSTAVLALLWEGGGVSGWWVVAGVLATAGYAWGLRPGT
jgi:hypothetical protein